MSDLDRIFLELITNIWTNNTSAKRFCKSSDIIKYVLSNLHHECAVAALFAAHKMRGGPMRALLYDNMSEILAAFIAHNDVAIKRKLFAVIHYTRIATKCSGYDEVIAPYAVAWMQDDVQDRDLAVQLLCTMNVASIRRVFDDAMARTMCDIFRLDWKAPASRLLQQVCKDSSRALSRIAPHIGDSLYCAFLEDRQSVEHLHPLLLHLRHTVHYSHDDRLVDYILLNAHCEREVRITATTLLTHALTKTPEAQGALVSHSRFLELEHHLRHKITFPYTVGTHRSSQLLLQMLQCNITMHTRTLDAIRSYVAASPQTFAAYAQSIAHPDTLDGIVRVGKLLNVSAKVLAPFVAEMDRIQQHERVTQRFNSAGISLKDVDTPSAFVCPVTLDVMKEPTVASDGHSYEKSTLTRLHKLRHKSPMTRERLDRSVAVPNVNLKKRIREYLDDVCTVVEKIGRVT